jgi:Fur family transcriptional regulator, ferric uptake regulator
MACEDHFVRQLHARGYRLTPQREAILSLLHHVEGFATADAICAHVREHCPHVDISTVYRTLELLTDLELVAMLDTGEGQRQYELVGVHGLHHHLHCAACDATIPLEAEALSPLLRSIRDEHGFIVQPGSLTFMGLCAECQSRAAARSDGGQLDVEDGAPS